MKFPKINHTPGILLILVVNLAPSFNLGAQEFERFDSRFSTIEFDSVLHVYFYDEFTKPEPRYPKYRGIEIDSSLYTLIDGEVDQLGNKYYATFKFRYARDIWAYIVRQPLQYNSTLLAMYLFNESEGELITSIELADSFGDGTWYFVRDAWIRDTNGDGFLDVITREKNFDLPDHADEYVE